MERFKPVRIDSKIYRADFYGILNAQGEFWTPLAFESKNRARKHIVEFFRGQPISRAQCLSTHKIVPVRIRLETLPTPGDG